MASSTAISYVCVFLASFLSLVASQGPSGSSLFNTLVNTQPAPNAFDPSLNSVGGGSAGLGNLLSNSMSTGFAAPTGTNNMPPNPSFPTLGGSTGMTGMNTGMGTGMMNTGSPLGSMPAPLPRPNPMSSIMPYLFLNGFDMSSNMLMMMMMNGGFGGGGGGAGGLFGNPLTMMLLGNNM